VHVCVALAVAAAALLLLLLLLASLVHIRHRLARSWVLRLYMYCCYYWQRV
jgi:hypothetical protein